MSAAALAPAAGAPEAPPRRSKLPLVVGALLAVAGGAGGFYAVQAGLLAPLGLGAAPAGEGGGGEAAGADGGDGHGGAASLLPMAFVPLPAVIVNLPASGEQRFLRFTAQLEVDPAHAEEVTAVVPRVMDVLNAYLRAVEVADIEDPTALMGLRAQMLRRVQTVAGEGRVRDLLVMEFVVN